MGVWRRSVFGTFSDLGQFYGVREGLWVDSLMFRANHVFWAGFTHPCHSRQNRISELKLPLRPCHLARSLSPIHQKAADMTPTYKGGAPLWHPSSLIDGCPDEANL